MSKIEDEIQREIEEAWASKSQAERDEIMSRHPAKGNKRTCEPNCGGYADYAALPCPNPTCLARVRALECDMRE